MDLFSKTNHLMIIETDQYNHVPFEVPFMELLNYYSLFDIGKEINIQFYISFRKFVLGWITAVFQQCYETSQRVSNLIARSPGKTVAV